MQAEVWDPETAEEWRKEMTLSETEALMRVHRKRSLVGHGGDHYTSNY